MKIRALGLSIVFVLCAGSSSAQLSELAKKAGLSGSSSLSDSKITSGLKQTLQIGAENAVKLTGHTDGYFKNEAIKILMPKNLQPVEKGLRMVGYGPKVDDFVLSMNRAAESAAPAAKKIFGDAILAMTFDDARKILDGGDTAATDYFKAKTTDQLKVAFRPAVEKTMSANGVTQQYKALMQQFQTIPFAKSPSLDLDDYVIGKSLDGLFYMLAQEEKKIRTDPAARVTSLLKDVFGK
jgi:hypothetical protein